MVSLPSQFDNVAGTQANNGMNLSLQMMATPLSPIVDSGASECDDYSPVPSGNASERPSSHAASSTDDLSTAEHNGVKRHFSVKVNGSTAGTAGDFGPTNIETTHRGYSVLLYGGFRYSRISDNRTKTYWRCTDRKCRAKLHTQEGHIIFVSHDQHDHLPGDKPRPCVKRPSVGQFFGSSEDTISPPSLKRTKYEYGTGQMTTMQLPTQAPSPDVNRAHDDNLRALVVLLVQMQQQQQQQQARKNFIQVTLPAQHVSPAPQAQTQAKPACEGDTNMRQLLALWVMQQQQQQQQLQQQRQQVKDEVAERFLQANFREPVNLSLRPSVIVGGSGSGSASPDASVTASDNDNNSQTSSVVHRIDRLSVVHRSDNDELIDVESDL